MRRIRKDYEPDPNLSVSEEVQELPSNLYTAIFFARMYYAENDSAQDLVKVLDEAIVLAQEYTAKNRRNYGDISDKDLAKLINESGIDMTVPNQGGESYTFIVGNDVIRIARHEEASQKIGLVGQSLKRLNEYKDLGLIDADIPRLIEYDPDYHLMRSSRVNGSPTHLDDLSEADSLSYTRQMGTFLGQLHSLPLDETKEGDFAVHRDGYNNWTEWMFEDARSKIEFQLAKETDEAVISDLQATLEFIDTYDPEGEDPVYLHGDFNHGNILFDQTSAQIGVIDFAPGAAGDRYRDFMYPLLYSSDAMISEMVDAYEAETGFKLDRAKLKAMKTIGQYYHTEMGQKPKQDLILR